MYQTFTISVYYVNKSSLDIVPKGKIKRKITNNLYFQRGQFFSGHTFLAT